MDKTLYNLGLPPPAAGAEAWVGRVIDGRYRILHLLGEGGMGSVFCAENVGFGKQVALKLIKPEFAGQEDLAERFNREALATARLRHPNIAAAHDFGIIPGGGAYLVMELVRGSSLEDRIASGEKMPWREACRIGAQIADALAAAHAIGIVHRDLKPDNVLVDTGGNVKVLDFGVARIHDVGALGVPARDLTRRGSVIGTPGYMAPEQAMGAVVDARCDLYSLGVILWECLTGDRLWDAETLTDLFTKQIGEEARPLPALDGIPGDLGPLLGQLLERVPERRPGSAMAVREVLLDMSHGAGSTTAGAVPPDATSGASPIERRGVRGRGRLYAAIAGAVVLVGVGVTLVLLGGGGSTRRADPGEASAPAAGPAIPAKIKKAARTLDTSTKEAERKQAAADVLAYTPRAEVPGYLALLAGVDLGDTCEQKLKALKALAVLEDRRSRPALAAIDAVRVERCRKSPRSCDACLEAPLRELLAALR